MQQVGQFLIPPDDFVEQHASRLGDDALLVFVAGLAVSSETGTRLLIGMLGEAERACRAAILTSWEAAVEAQSEAKAVAA